MITTVIVATIWIVVGFSVLAAPVLDREQAQRIADGDEGLQRLLEATLELNRRISTVHERQDCPTCWAPRNVRCRAMPKGYVVGRTGRVGGRELKHAHDARLRADGITLR